MSKRHNLHRSILAALLLGMGLAVGSLSGCGAAKAGQAQASGAEAGRAQADGAGAAEGAAEEQGANIGAAFDAIVSGRRFGSASAATAAASVEGIPAYAGAPYTVVNGNVPGFTDADWTTQPFETYSDLDSLRRCGPAYANVCEEIMPTEKRGSIGGVKPTGWQLVKYDVVEGGYLYNRCHLIAYELSAENANEKNLITGTRYMNVQGMLPFENKVHDYVQDTGNHVLYRATPLFQGNNLVAAGVQIEAASVEDRGESLSFNVFCYNVQPRIHINYANGDNYQDDVVYSGAAAIGAAGGTQGARDYVLNTRSMKFHLPDCSAVQSIGEGNRADVTATRDDLTEQGYAPCGRCKP